ncbi:MAG: hypothetical protein U0176_08400 [Bacteroidia bacterium]
MPKHRASAPEPQGCDGRELAKRGGDVTKPEVEKVLIDTAKQVAANFQN